MDDFIPSKIPGRNLENYIFQKPGSEQSRRASALSRTHTNRHPKLLVQICNPHLKALPHGGRKRSKRHSTNDQGINFPDRWNPAFFPQALNVFPGRKNPTQEGSHFKFMAARIKSRVRKHGDPGKFYPVQNGLR